MNSYTHALTDVQVEGFAVFSSSQGSSSHRRSGQFFLRRKTSSAWRLREGTKGAGARAGVEEFVQFELEPKVLGEAKLGYEEVHSPEMFEPHFGVDESGKGDFFGPLVISGVYVDRGIAAQASRRRDRGQQAH
jgi:ribonuclease HIII